MNYQIIRNTSNIFYSYTLFSQLNTIKTKGTLLNNLKSLHLSAITFSPRFTKDSSNDEISTELSESMNGIPHISRNNAKSKEPLVTNKSEEDVNWNEVEATMFHNQKSKGVEIPKLHFKGNRTFIQKERNLFNMNDIDKKSMKEKKVIISPKQQKPVKRLSEPEIIYDQDIGQYFKLERDDPLLDKLFMTIQTKKQKDFRKNLVLEGRRLVQEGIEAGLKLETLVFSKIEQVKAIRDLILKSKAKLYKVANHNIKLWSQLSTTPGILGIFTRPDNLNELIEKRRPKNSIIPVSIILDNIREPNNLGAIIRSAAAAGAYQVILTKGCCTNPWDLKCIRGSSGTHFYIKIVGPVEWEETRKYLPQHFEYYIADNQLNQQQELPVIDYDSLDFEKSIYEHKVLVIGGEAQGISNEARDFQKQHGATIRIPLVDKVNSLNVATALSVVLFEMRRKLNLIKNASKEE